jgi:hypothetical protein
MYLDKEGVQFHKFNMPGVYTYYLHTFRYCPPIARATLLVIY